MGEERWGRWNGSHEHASDDDEETPQQRLRTRSFSDAEDILNGVGYYESFTLPDKNSTAPSNGLHHRVRATFQSNDSQDDDQDPHRPIRSRGSCRSPLSRNVSRRKHYGCFFGRRPSLLKVCLAVGFGSYLIMLIRSSYWLASRSSEEYDQENQYVAGPPATITQSLSQYHHSHPERPDLRLYRIELEERNLQRRKRTIPIAGNVAAPELTWYSLDDKEQNQSAQAKRSTPASKSTPATLNQLCGFHAQNSSLANPQNYPATAAVNSNARVLITGILNPIGFPLALYLKEHCGVEVIAGMDAMYPNTVLNRLELQDRIELLTTTIPKLVKPIILPFVGLDPRQKKEGSKDNTDTDDSKLKSSEFNIMSLNPTHIVHVASYSQEVYSNAMVDPTWKNGHSPYVSDDEKQDPHLYQLRSSMTSMEQILESIASIESPEDRPQFIYASAQPHSQQHPVHATTKLMDEIMANSYHARYDIQSTAIRLPLDIYGPWGQPGFPIHDMIETMVRNWNATRDQVQLSGIKPNLDLIYFEDAIEAIVGAMQIRTSEPLTVDVVSDVETISSALTEKLPSFLPSAPAQEALVDNLGLKQKRVIQASKQSHLEFLPRTPLKQGMLKTIAWHLDREAPFGPAVETGDAFLKRFGQDTCAADDTACHMSRHYLPCASECNTREKCIPSVLDSVRELVNEVTEGCNIVLYTSSLGYNVKEMPLHGEYMDDATVGDDDTLICNYAFVPRDSDLVATVTEKVPNEQLAKFGIKPEQSDVGKSMRDRKLDGLNARLLYRGWILIWVEDATTPLSATDKSLLKLSPGRFFHSDVHHSFYVEDNFPVSPSIDDIVFLVQQMKRKALPKRTATGTKSLPGPNGDVIKEKVKYVLPAEPNRKAAMLFTPLRFPNVDDPTVQKYRYGSKKLNVYDAIKFMRHEIGEMWGEKESPSLRLQREFYERVPSIINRNGELRSSYEPWYRYNMRHWVRTRWVLHDLTIEDSRLLRCDWYQEHVQWGNDLDQLSFAHVMAQREIKRRIAHDETDDHVKTYIEEHPELKEVTDSYEWTPLETEHNKLYREPLKWNPELPAHIMVPEEKVQDEEEFDERAPLYVRIMSERVMGAARKGWNKPDKKAKTN
jgi:hypothetical protein